MIATIIYKPVLQAPLRITDPINRSEIQHVPLITARNSDTNGFARTRGKFANTCYRSYLQYKIKHKPSSDWRKFGFDNAYEGPIIMYFRSVLIILFALGASCDFAHAEDNCVDVAGQSLDPSEIYSSKHSCSTCAGQSEHLVCAVTNRLMVPYWSKPADLVTIPHRGLWGQPLSQGASENTLAALDVARQQGKAIIEIDVTFTGTTDENRDVFLGHYFSMASVSGPADRAPSDYTPEQITAFKMNKRDMSPATDQLDALTLFRDVLVYADSHEMLLMVDPKAPAGVSPNYLEEIIWKVLQIAKEENALEHVTIKTQRGYADIVGILNSLSGLKFSDEYEGRFLWSPITKSSLPNTEDPYTLKDITDFVDLWHINTEQSKQIATYEINLFSPEFFGSRPFSIDNVSYHNLVDYVKELTPLGKRSAFWSVDPMGDKGTFGRLYNWKFIGNTADDKRGNPIVNLSYWGATHVAINTDRPQQYDTLVVEPY